MKRKGVRRLLSVHHELVLTSTLVVCTTCVTDSAMRDNRRPTNGEVRDAAVPSMTATSEPGPQHERLAALIGNWNAEARMWNNLGEPSEEGRGKISNFWMLDDRFVGQEYKSRGRNPQFQGLGALGYDNAGGFYTSVWIDTVSTAMLTGRGSYDQSGKVLTFEGKTADPATGGFARIKSVIRILHKNRYTFELFSEGPGGEMYKTLEFTFTRD